MPSLPRPGDRLAGFRIVRELGHGTTGTVYLAHQEALDRSVALKVVGRPLADDAAFRDRFRREARTAAGLDHPNVVQILEVGEDDAHLWLAMRLVDGPDLRVLLRRTGRLEPVQAVAIVEQVAAALDAAHAAGLVHRDVKPGNVLIEDGPGRDLHVELADFGLARPAGVDGPGGTPGYAAPEQLAGGEAGVAADVFGLGCVLFELLTGTPPPPPVEPAGPRAPAPPPLRPSAALPRLGGAFDPAVGRATAADPAERFASAGELAVWARAALTVPVAPAVADPDDPVRLAAAAPASPAEVVAAAPTWEIPPPAPRRRGRRVLVALFLALVLGVLAAAFVSIGDLGDASRDRRAGTTPTPPGPAGTVAGGSGGSAGTAGTGAGSAGASGGSSTGSAGASGGSGGTSGRAGSSTRGGGAGAGGAGSPSGGTGSSASGATSSATGGAGGSGGPSGRSGTASGGSDPASRQAGGATGRTRGSTTGRATGTGRSASVGAAPSSSAPGPSPTARARPTGPSAGTPGVPQAPAGTPTGSTVAPLPPVPAGATRFGGGTWVLDLPTAEGWRQTAVQEQEGGARILTRLQRPDAVRIVVEALPGRAAVVGVPGARRFPVRLPEAGRTDGALYRGGRYAMCADGGVCAALPANGPSGGVLLVVGGHRAAGTKRVARRAASGLRVR